MTEAPQIRLSRLTKSYQATEAVRGVDLEVFAGERFGLIGPDGAGKTTLLRMLCGLIQPDGGEVRVLGFDPAQQQHAFKEAIGYMPQRFSLYPDLSVIENLRFFADIYQVKNNEQREAAARLLAFSRLEPFKKRRAQALSGGMKQKLALACTLMHTPKLLILDEPTTGVDPVSRGEFWDILDDLRRQGVTVLVTTPYMDEASRCDRIALMHNGRLMDFGTPDDVISRFPHQIIRIFTSEPQRAAEILVKAGGFQQVQPFGDRVHIVCDDIAATSARVLEQLSGMEIPVQSLEAGSAGLEDVFIYLMTVTA